LSQIIRSFASSVVFACPAQEQRKVPALFETLLPIAGHCDPSRGSSGSGVGVGVGVGVGSTGLNTGFRFGFGFGAALTATPLFHTSLVPDFIQVNFFPPTVDVAPTFVHFAPALTAANEGAITSEMDRTKARRIRARVMAIRYQATIPNQIESWSKFGHGDPLTEAPSNTLYL
jgi:hypothetical protein